MSGREWNGGRYWIQVKYTRGDKRTVPGEVTLCIKWSGKGSLMRHQVSRGLKGVWRQPEFSPGGTALRLKEQHMLRETGNARGMAGRAIWVDKSRIVRSMRMWQKWWDSGTILKIEPTGYADGFEVGFVKREIFILVWSSGILKFSFTDVRNMEWDAGLEMKIQSSIEFY